MRRSLVTLTLLAALGTAASAHAQSSPPADFIAACEARLPPTAIQVRLAPLNYVTGAMSLAELNAKHKEANGTTLGLTQAKQVTQGEFGGTRLKSADGWACMRPTINIDVSVGPQMVYVGAEFPRGTCSYSHILTHELRHVQTNQQHAVSVVQQFEGEIRRAFANTIYYGRSEDLTANLERVVNNGWFPQLQARLADNARLHALIDTPQEYAGNATACGGEILGTLLRKDLRERFPPLK